MPATTLAVLAGQSSSDNAALDVIPASQVANLSFLAKPSRLPVNLHNGISGAVYVFDAYQNLITDANARTFQLSGESGVTQTHTAMTRDGRAWTQMDSAAKEGAAHFTARVGDISSTRIIQQVPGDPCGLRMSARPSGQKDRATDRPLAGLQRQCGAGWNGCHFHGSA